MAHPLHHSLSSVRKFGGQPEDYLALHSYFDQTKTHFADFRHRALRHHTQGIERAVLLFGTTLKNSDGVEVSVASVGEQHVIEDCERLVSMQDWAENLKLERWMKPANAKEFCPEKKWRGKREDYHVVSAFFAKGEPMITNHSAGCFDLEQELGYSILNSVGRKIPVRTLGEDYLQCKYRRIPTPIDWLKNIRQQPWMIRTKKIERTL